MDIEAFIKKEAPGNSDHDKAYSRALREVYQACNGESRESLLKMQEIARAAYRVKGPTHYATASVMVLYELLNT